MKNLKINLKNVIALSVMGAVMSSCDLMDSEESNMEDNAFYSATASSNLIYLETFEGSDPLSFTHHQFSEDHSFGTAQNPILEGSYSGRFELRDDDEMTANGTRAEVLFPEQDHNERWYSYSLYLPSDGFKIDSNNDIISQWHQGSGSGSPTTTLRIKNDRFFLKSGPTKEERVDYDIAEVQKDAWNEFVFHIVHSGGEDGLVEVWLNGEQVLNIKGGNLNKDFDLPRWKIGIYKDDWNYDETTDTDLRIMYFDNVRMGDENATFEDMTSLESESTEESTTEESTTDSTDDGSTTDSTDDGSTTEETTEEETTTEEESTTESTDTTEEEVILEAGNSGNEIPGNAKGHNK